MQLPGQLPGQPALLKLALLKLALQLAGRSASFFGAQNSTTIVLRPPEPMAAVVCASAAASLSFDDDDPSVPASLTAGKRFARLLTAFFSGVRVCVRASRRLGVLAVVVQRATRKFEPARSARGLSKRSCRF